MTPAQAYQRIPDEITLAQDSGRRLFLRPKEHELCVSMYVDGIRRQFGYAFKDMSAAVSQFEERQ